VQAHHLGVARAVGAHELVRGRVAVALRVAHLRVRATPGSRWYVSSTLQKNPAASCASSRPSPAGASVSGSMAGFFAAPSAAAAELDMATSEMLVAGRRGCD